MNPDAVMFPSGRGELVLFAWTFLVQLRLSSGAIPMLLGGVQWRPGGGGGQDG